MSPFRDPDIGRALEQHGRAEVLAVLLVKRFGQEAAAPDLVRMLSRLDPRRAIALIDTSATVDQLAAHL